MKTKQTIVLLFALGAVHLGAWAQRDTAVVAAAAAPVHTIPGGEKADSVQRAAPADNDPGLIGHNARSKYNPEGGQCPAGFEPGRIGGK